jgi:hypothetical protein
MNYSKNTKKALLSLIIGLFAIISTSTSTALAQSKFEGSIHYKLYDIEEGGKELKEDGSFFIHFSKDRIMLTNQSSYAVPTGSYGFDGVNGLLLRSDMQDFLLISDTEKNAIQIQKASIDALLSFINNMSEDEVSDKSSYSDEDMIADYQPSVTMKIAGKKAALTVFKENPKSKNKSATKQEFYVWNATDFRVNWGMLTEPWVEKVGKDAPSSFFKYIKNGEIPLRIEIFENGKRQGYLECVNIEQKTLPAALVNVPSGYEVLDLTTFIFKSFMGN